MPAISAIDAIGPAVQRTRAFLFQPFRLSTYLKLCLVAVLTEGYCANFNFNFSWPTGHPHSHAYFANAPSRLTPGVIAAIAAGALVCFLLAFVFFYLITRLRFAYFHCLVHNIRQIRPGWHLYRAQATRFFWFNVVVGLWILLFAVVVALPFGFAFWRMFRRPPPGSHPPVGIILPLLLLLFVFVFLLTLTALAIDVVLRDFMLPHFALENATATQAWEAAWARIRTEKLPFFVYTLLRIVLPFAVIMGIFLVLIIPALLVAAVFVVAGIGIHSAFGWGIAGILLEVLLGLVGLTLAVLIGLCIGGPLSTAIREYALLFYGSRYEPLGGLLFPPSDTPLPAPQTP